VICPVCQAENEPTATTCRSCAASLPPAAPTGPTAVIVTVDLSPGTLFHGRYEILGTLGRGGMGMVYRARDKTLDEIVAIKVLRPDFAQDPTMAGRFRSEIKLARKVRHRNVCAIHDYGEEKGLLYISMELVEGIDLKRLLREKGALRFEEAFDVSIQIAEGLQAVHDAGIIHRDLKSPNIMVDPQKVARLMDFGIAKRQEGGGASTATGQILGTPEYMSPEQAQGQHVDFRSDVYALGIVIYEIFTGDVPFRGETPISTILKHLHDPPPIDAARLPDSLRPVLKSALSKEPEGRYPTARALAEALRTARATGRRDHEVPTAVLEAPTLAHPSMAAPRRSNGLAIAGSIVAIGAIALAVKWNSGSADQTAPPVETRPSPTVVPPSPVPTPAPIPSPGLDAGYTPQPSPSQTRRPPTPRPTVSPTQAPVPSPTSSTVIPPTPAPVSPPSTPTPALEPGQLQLGVKPWAEVVVDGRVIGTTPLDKVTLDPGSHVVVLRHPAYEELRRTVAIPPGGMIKLTVDLAKEGTPKR
jgi:serine/threonine protein kinase